MRFQKRSTDLGGVKAPLAAFGTAWLLVLSLVCTSMAKGASDREIIVGDLLPSTTLEALDGSQVTVPSGKDLTVVVFWATWSPRSGPALDLWQQFSSKYSDQSLSIVALNAEKVELEPGDRNTIDTYIQDHALALPMIIDEGLVLFNSYGVKALPTAFFLDREGKLLHRYPSFPSSAPLDLEEELEVRLGLRDRPSTEETAGRGKLEYQPKNNALLHYNMGVQLYKKGYEDKAVQRFVIALQKDPDYSDPLRTLEGIYMGEEKTADKEAQLKQLLAESGLDGLIEKVGQKEPIILKEKKKMDAMERMRQLLEKGGDPGAGGQ